MRSLLPLPPWTRLEPAALSNDVWAALVVTFLAVPQGMAYATIAELPPATGLYAAALPAVVGSLLRSSRHVVAGPTNSVSLLIGAALLLPGAPDPAVAAVTLAFAVGVVQILAGVLRLGAVIDYISSSVVTGYITGAGVLIGVGQLYNVTGTQGARGSMAATLLGWWGALGQAHLLTLGLSIATVATLVALRKARSRVPGAVVVLGGGILLNLAFDLEARGLRVVRDLAPVPSGLPPLTFPDLGELGSLWGIALACSLLSLVESNAVARAIADRSGQRLDASVEFTGQGFANLTAAFFGGYPTSGSLSRSVLNEQAGAQSRVAGMLAGALMLGVLLFAGPLLDHTPIASLAGLLLVVAWDLVDGPRIKALWRAGLNDRLTFLITLLSTWVLPLDKAILVGVAISLVGLRHGRFGTKLRDLDLRTGEPVAPSPESSKASPGVSPPDAREDPDPLLGRVRGLQPSNALRFASAGALETSLRAIGAHPETQLLVLHLGHCPRIDATAMWVLLGAAARFRERGQRLMLVGVSPTLQERLERAGLPRLLEPGDLRGPVTSWAETRALLESIVRPKAAPAESSPASSASAEAQPER